MQRFSLKSFSVEPKPGSVIKKILKILHFSAAWFINSAVYALLTFRGYHIYQNSVDRDNVELFMELFTIADTFAAISSNLISTWVSNRRFCKFFADADEISRLWQQEFGYSFSYKRLKRVQQILMICFFALCVGACITISVTFDFNSSLYDFGMSLVVVVPTIALQFIHIKFYFHMQIEKFHLEFLSYMIRREFQQPEPCITSSLNINDTMDVIEVDPEHARKMQSFRKIFAKIKNMHDQLSKSMEFIVLLIFFKSAVSCVKNGFAVFMKINNNSTGGDSSRRCVFSHVSLVWILLTYVFAEIVTAFAASIIGIMEIFYPCQRIQTTVRRFRISLLKTFIQYFLKLAEMIHFLTYVEVEGILTDVEAREQMENFSDCLKCKPLQFSVCGFFVINYTYLLSVSTNAPLPVCSMFNHNHVRSLPLFFHTN
jgi:7tm Chemosensory receptor